MVIKCLDQQQVTDGHVGDEARTTPDRLPSLFGVLVPADNKTEKALDVLLARMKTSAGAGEADAILDAQTHHAGQSSVGRIHRVRRRQRLSAVPAF